MIWPPVKAWTSKSYIDGQVHFVAINYGGELQKRWVILMSVLDSSVVVKLYWDQLSNPFNWESGWEDKSCSSSSKEVDNNYEIIINNCMKPSADSGLTIPITKEIIRPWFSNN